MLFATEGADVAIVYLNEHDDAADTKRRVEAEGPGLSTSLLLSEQRYRQHTTHILVYSPCQRFFSKTS
jgi:hypothetical protein